MKKYLLVLFAVASLSLATGCTSMNGCCNSSCSTTTCYQTTCNSCNTCSTCW